MVTVQRTSNLPSVRKWAVKICNSVTAHFSKLTKSATNQNQQHKPISDKLGSKYVHSIANARLQTLPQSKYKGKHLGLFFLFKVSYRKEDTEVSIHQHLESSYQHVGHTSLMYCPPSSFFCWSSLVAIIKTKLHPDYISPE